MTDINELVERLKIRARDANPGLYRDLKDVILALSVDIPGDVEKIIEDLEYDCQPQIVANQAAAMLARLAVALELMTNHRNEIANSRQKLRGYHRNKIKQIEELQARIMKLEAAISSAKQSGVVNDTPYSKGWRDALAFIGQQRGGDSDGR